MKTLVRMSTILIIVVMQASISFGQGAKVKKAKLVDWKFNACDNTYDPYRLTNRITERRTQDGITFLTVNFTDNCCAAFKPQMAFTAL